MPSTIRDLTELTAVASDDYILISDTSDVTNRDKRISKTNLLGGTLSLGGFTLTVPATGTAALLGTAQTFTATQTMDRAVIAPAAGTGIGLNINEPAGNNANAFIVQYDGATRVAIWARPTETVMQYLDLDAGASFGPQFRLGRNSNASTPGAGSLYMTMMGAGIRTLWVDNAGQFRIHTANPTNALDTAGSVVGTQTSQLAAKNVLGDGIAPQAALSKLLETPVVEFEYRNKSYNGSRFHGIVAEWSPEFAMDNNRSFNPVSAFGYSVQSTKALYQLISELQEKVSLLENRLLDAT